MSYMRLGLALAALLAIVGAFFYGQSVGKARCEASYAAASEKARKQREDAVAQAQQQDTSAAIANVERQTIVREITREVPRIVDRPVYRNVCVDADGVRLIDRAVDAANGRGASGGGTAGEAGRVQPPASDRDD